MFWRQWLWHYFKSMAVIVVVTLIIGVTGEQHLWGLSLSASFFWLQLYELFPLSVLISCLWSTATHLALWRIDGRWESAQLCGISGSSLFRGWQRVILLSATILSGWFCLLSPPSGYSISSSELVEGRQVRAGEVDLIRYDDQLFFAQDAGYGVAGEFILHPSGREFIDLDWHSWNGQEHWSVERFMHSKGDGRPIGHLDNMELWDQVTENRAVMELWKRFALPWLLLPAGWFVIWLVLNKWQPATTVLLVSVLLLGGQRLMEVGGYGLSVAIFVALIWIFLGFWCRNKVDEWPLI